MSLRFDDKVALVTGAGAGIGRHYALYLAARGAKVVVNDFGSTGEGANKQYLADIVVDEIKAAGGQAAASRDSVVDGEKVIQTCLDAFGGIHIIINNAGILRDVSFKRQSDAQWDIVLKVHLYATRNLCRAAWKHMTGQKYGRIVNITSVNGLYGQFGQTNYSAAKAGIVGFSMALAIEGAKKNVKVNVVAPGAGTAMTKTIMPGPLVDLWKPDFVAPMVAFLAHEEVPSTGCIYEAGGGWFSQVKYMRTPGLTLNIDKPMEMEDIAENWSSVISFNGATDPVQDRANGIDNQLKQVMAKFKLQSKL